MLENVIEVIALLRRQLRHKDLSAVKGRERNRWGPVDCSARSSMAGRPVNLLST
jgi:hypothetical protein